MQKKCPLHKGYCLIVLLVCIIATGSFLEGGRGGELIWTEQHSLTPDDLDYSDGYGWDVEIDGDTAVVGSRFDDDKGEDAGAVYVYVKSEGAWLLQQKIYASDADVDDSFGIGLALDGDTLVVGANRDNNLTGAAYVFTRSGEVWTEQQKIVPDEAEEGIEFGYALSLSGDTLLAGMDWDDGVGVNTGAVFVYVRSGKTWNVQQKLVASDAQEEDWFGTYVFVDGDVAAISSGQNDEAANDGGALYFFTRSGDTWMETQKVVASDAEQNHYFGGPMVIEGDVAFIAAFGADMFQGAVYVFTRSSDSWTEQQKLVASDAEDLDIFGTAVSLFGDVAVIGAPGRDENGSYSGATYIFHRSGDEWVESQKIMPGEGEANDWFGTSISSTSDSIFVGATTHPNQENVGGPTTVFELTDPLENGAFCSEGIQCQSGFCVDGVCCNEPCGGDEPLDCEACSVSAGASVDGECAPLNGTVCDDGDPLTTDDICEDGECVSQSGDTDTDTETDTDTDTETDTDTDTETDTETDSGTVDQADNEGCNCSSVGGGLKFTLLHLFSII